jgi:menaquinone-dependent protoporphyrinogen oxidase
LARNSTGHPHVAPLKATIRATAMTRRSHRNVLVAYGSQAGSTRQVAERIASSLRARQLRVDVAPITEVEDAFTYKAFVIGSCVYNGSWLPEAVAFVRQQRRALARRPVWLFSVGAFGDTHRIVGRFMKTEPREIEELKATLHPLSYRVFAGVIDPQRWSRVGRLAHHAFGGRDGDNRNWREIEAWAESVADELANPGKRRQRRHGPPPTAKPGPSLLRSVRTTREERTRRLPGDRLIDQSMATLTHAITIEADRDEVWPWLVQMGAGTRGGWYSYDRLDNGGARSADRIIPALQMISVGTLFPALPGATDGFHVLQHAPGRSLVLGWREGDGEPLVTWAFALKHIVSARTRLIVRVRAVPDYSFRGLPRWLGLPIIRVVHWVMQRKQLLGIARRAESHQRARRALEREVA